MSANDLENQEKLESQPTSDSENSVKPTRREVIKEQVFSHFNGKVESRDGYIPLLACCFVTGLTDGTIYNCMYSVLKNYSRMMMLMRRK